ncbi:hypothetical protein L3X38_037584 [Prunus dulcis]|uniref:Uncharacterized protein n=1 Tax=Prunus dulcis TaxID=3755 RepID=A0AAD4V5B9_PRUDU|nr:hypothetical protein L3X38_037584 [Prunus dulcis]
MYHNNNFKLHKHSTLLRTKPHTKLHKINLEVLLINRHNVQKDNLQNKGLGRYEQQGDLNNSLKDEYMLLDKWQSKMNLLWYRVGSGRARGMGKGGRECHISRPTLP